VKHHWCEYKPWWFVDDYITDVETPFKAGYSFFDNIAYGENMPNKSG
jgi:hypothetical protein